MLVLNQIFSVHILNNFTAFADIFPQKAKIRFAL